jgi:hypothetical protein
VPRLDEARTRLALANRILAHEGVLDAFGHVSMRHPFDPNRYLLARSRCPELTEPRTFWKSGTARRNVAQWQTGQGLSAMGASVRP